MINQLIANLNNGNIRFFFENKISSFKPEQEVFENLVSEEKPYADPLKIGHAELNNHEELLVFSCYYKSELTARSAKKQQFEIAKKILKEDFKDGAIFIFYDNAGNFRFSFIRKNYGNETSKYSNWKRFTYYVDPLKKNQTFRTRMESCRFDSLDDIQKCFSVEPLSKQFYRDLSYWYFWSLNEIEFPNDQNENESKLKANAMIRLITRIIFVWFMKQKKLVPDALFDEGELQNLLQFDDSTGSTYYKAILQNLFFATLSTPKENNRTFVTSQYGVQNFFRYKRFIKDEKNFLALMDGIPFLNGGLFENLDIVKPEEGIEIRIDCFSENKKNEKKLVVPDYLFFGESTADVSDHLNNEKLKNVPVVGLIDLLKRYDFTIDENTPYDQEVALDPELLGLVFENLLASYNPESQDTARRESGSFYTPREIVDYMVEESLVQSVLNSTKLEEEKLRQLFKSNDNQPFKEKKEKEQIVNSLSKLKILDPACGSGAFPMGALQKLTHILGKLDDDNSIWQATQKRIAIEETIAEFDSSTSEERKQRMATIEEVFEKGQNEPDYARKLYLIENCLYGVDIQPIAMQIAKLRFFISLLVEQKIDENKENFGIIALPNLETKFVAANTLIGLPGKKNVTGQLQFKSDIVIKLEKELESVRHKHFSARTTKTKKKYRLEDKRIREEIAEHLDDALTPDAVHAITNWNPYNPNGSSGWFDTEWMFGLESFDIVIGNPPYIQLQKALPGHPNLKYGDLYKNEEYKTFARKGDIYELFYEQGINLLSNKGLLSFITSNKWMRTAYGAKLREFLSQRKPLVLLDLGPGVFEAATVDVNILFVERSSVTSHRLSALTVTDSKQIQRFDDLQMGIIEDLSSENWIIISPGEKIIKEKIENLGMPLNQWDIKVTYGIRTGFNKAYIINNDIRKDLISKDPKLKDLIKPILRGRDISRYTIDFSDLYVLLVHKGFHKELSENYPVLYTFLEKFEVELKSRGQVKNRSHHWLELDNSPTKQYLTNFKQEKIIYQEMVQESSFAYDASGEFYCNDTARIITGSEIKFLLPIFNSKLFFFSVKKFYGGGGLGSKGIRMKNTFFERFQVPQVNKGLKKRIIDLSEEVQVLKNSSINSLILEKEIDMLIYSIYNLNYSEVLIIDPSICNDEYKNLKISIENGQ